MRVSASELSYVNRFLVQFQQLFHTTMISPEGKTCQSPPLLLKVELRHIVIEFVTLFQLVQFLWRLVWSHCQFMKCTKLKLSRSNTTGLQDVHQGDNVQCVDSVIWLDVACGAIEMYCIILTNFVHATFNNEARLNYRNTSLHIEVHFNTTTNYSLQNDPTTPLLKQFEQKLNITDFVMEHLLQS